MLNWWLDGARALDTLPSAASETASGEDAELKVAQGTREGEDRALSGQ